MRLQPLNFLRPTLAGVLGVLLIPIAAAAQTPAKAPALPRIDVTGYATWLGAQAHDIPDTVYRNWDGTGAAALGVGYYWTEHLKLELDVERAGERELYGSVSLEASRNASRYRYDSYYVASQSVTLAANYQFLHNTWVHPFVGAGLETQRERRRLESEIRTFSSAQNGSSVESLPDEITRTWRSGLALATGAKFYASPRVFLRTDVRVTVGNQADAIRWRFGGGIDF